MERALERAAGRHRINTVIDVGASNGSWFNLARRAFPGVRGLLIEAQANPHEPALRALHLKDPTIDYVIAAAGDREGAIHFDASEPFSGAANREPFARNDVVVQMTSIDAEVTRRGLKGPFLIKLDTHGFESQILDGAAITLTDTAALIIEAYNFELRPGVLRFHELCSLLDARGFRCIDVADPMRRPGDGVLWQMDLVFARHDQTEFATDGYI
jgi:FkbM family methyltransferase